MKRLFQLGSILMLIGAIYPLLEIFDCWDAPGVSNDTEFAIYALLFSLCLVLLVCKLVASGALRFVFFKWRIFPPHKTARPIEADHLSFFDVPLLFDLPLRI